MWTPGGQRTRRAAHTWCPAAPDEHQPGINAVRMAQVTGTARHQETDPRTKSRMPLTKTIPRASCEAWPARTHPEGNGCQ
jgi:hypothetical protein